MNWFKKKLVSQSKPGLTQIKRFDTREEYIKLLIDLISDTRVDFENWDKSSFITSYGGSLTFTKGRCMRPSFSISKNEVQIRLEFGFSNSDGEFKCNKIDLKIGGIDKLTLEDCNKIIGDESVKIFYDFYCSEQIWENKKLSKDFNQDKEVVDLLISTSTKRDDKLNSLGI
jgi:hypothetical protein